MSRCGPGWRRTGESDEKTFVCQYSDCNKAFYRKDHLTRHQRQKHGKPFGVDSQLVFYCHNAECGKMFYKVSTLRRHMVEAHQYGELGGEYHRQINSWIIFPHLDTF
jgi:uncharacterized Zn-finger protein